MFIPLGTDRPLRRPTVVTHWLIGACALIYLTGILLERYAPETFEHMFNLYALNPSGAPLWGFITYQFLHGGFWHILFNMLFLWVFGPPVEDRFGRLGFLAFYLVGGIAAGAAQIALVNSGVIGASGSIAAVTGAFLVLFPKTNIRTLLFFFFIGVYHIPATWFIGFAIFWDFIMQGAGGGDGVARLAHLGGYLFGFTIAFTLLATKALPREPYDLFSISRQARRRRAFRELASKGATPWASDAGAPLRAKKKLTRTNAAEEALAAKRTEVSRLHADREFDAAAAAYLKLLNDNPDLAMSRNLQLDIANHLHQQNTHADAARAYRVFLTRHPNDSEAPRVRLLLGLLLTRYLNEPEEARPLLTQCADSIMDEQQRALARTLLAELPEESKPQNKT